MKKKIAAYILLTCLSMGLMGAAQASPSSLEKNDAALYTPLRHTGTRWTLTHFLALLGKNDKEAADFFGGGTPNYTADGTFTIGRTYPVRLFGENREAGTLYDRDGKVQSITVQLEDPRAAAYEPVLTWYYGAPTKVQSVPSEAGATYTEWTHENARIRLYQMYGLSALEVTPSEKGSHTVTPPLWGGKWIPEDIRRTTSGMKKFPPLERAIIKTYGIGEAERKDTRYAYEILDLDGDGTLDVLAIVSGPYTSGTGGDSALWGTFRNGTFEVKQTFTLMRTPLIVTADPTSLIVRRSGGGAPSKIVRLDLKDGKFAESRDENVMKDLKKDKAVVLFDGVREMRL